MVKAQGASTCGRAIGKFKFASIKYIPRELVRKKINHLLSLSKLDLKRIINE